MKKNDTNFKSTFLNFKIKNTNEDVQKLNLHLYNVSFLNTIIFAVITIPIIVFSIMFFTDSNLKFYFENWNDLKQTINVPSKNEMMVPLIFSWICIVTSFIFIFLLKPTISSKGIKNVYKDTFWIVLLCVEILAFLFAAIAQYKHTTYQEFFNFESRISVETSNETITRISQYFSENKEKAYVWASEDSVWWILFIQIIIVFMMSLSIQNAIVVDVKHLNIEKYITYINKKQKNLNNSKLKVMFLKIFNTSDKTLAVWTILTAFCILIPSLVYVLLTSFNSTQLAKLSSFINSFPDLMQRFDRSNEIVEKYSSLISYSNSYFLYSSLPVITIGITFSTLLYFVSVSIRGENRSQMTFVVQYYIIGVELFLVLVVTFYSQIQMNNLVDEWNKVNGTQRNGLNFFEDISKMINNNENGWYPIEKYYQIDSFNKELNFSFIKPINVICEGIVFLSLLITSYTIIGKNLFDKSNFKNRIESHLLR